MKFYIKEWADETATLMTEMGYVQAYFSSISDAKTACYEWCFANHSEQKNEIKVYN